MKKSKKKRLAAPPGPVREWVTFPDPDDENHRWLVDVTWLTSPWQCIFGCGCQGVLTGPTPEMQQGCCSYGAHFTDDDDRYVFQGVHMMLEGDHQRKWKDGEARESRVVFIGRELPEQMIRDGFESCITT